MSGNLTNHLLVALVAALLMGVFNVLVGTVDSNPTGGPASTGHQMVESDKTPLTHRIIHLISIVIVFASLFLPA
jgi:hypothetical protein